MKKLHVVTIQVLVESDCEGEAADCANELLRESQKIYAPTSCLIDYSVGSIIEFNELLDHSFERTK